MSPEALKDYTELRHPEGGSKKVGNAWQGFSGPCYVRGPAPPPGPPAPPAPPAQKCVAPRSCVFEKDVHYPGSDMGSAHVDSAQTCCDKCSEKEGCVKFVFQAASKGSKARCKMKSHAGKVQKTNPKDGYTSGECGGNSTSVEGHIRLNFIM